MIYFQRFTSIIKKYNVAYFIIILSVLGSRIKKTGSRKKELVHSSQFTVQRLKKQEDFTTEAQIRLRKRLRRGTLGLRLMLRYGKLDADMRIGLDRGL